MATDRNPKTGRKLQGRLQLDVFALAGEAAGTQPGVSSIHLLRNFVVGRLAQTLPWWPPWRWNRTGARRR